MVYTTSVAVIGDGHCMNGPHGADIATFACRQMSRCLREIDCTTWNPEVAYEWMPRIMQSIHNDYLEIMKEPGVLIEDGVPMRNGVRISGGTTLLCAVHGTYEKRPYVMTAGVGDSDAFLFTKKGDVCTWEQLNQSHKPVSQSEYFRIQKHRDLAGHFVYDTKGATSVNTYLPIFEDDGSYVWYEDTFATWEAAREAYNVARSAFASATPDTYEKMKETVMMRYKEYQAALLHHESSPDGRRYVSTVRNDRSAYIMNEWNGIKLSVTRSIGDYAASSMGIITDPDVQIRWIDDLDCDSAILFLATDGLLDCYPMDELATLVLTTPRESLMELFYEKAKKIYGNDHDDITFVMKELQ